MNSVGVDAVVPQTATRCVAGGYVWNPFYTQLADPLNVSDVVTVRNCQLSKKNIFIMIQNDLYQEECGPDDPLRCYVGDVSSRIGVIGSSYKSQVHP